MLATPPGHEQMQVGVDSEGDGGETGWVEVYPRCVLAECEAKRRIVEWASDGEGEFHWWTVLGPLAAVYADHPD